MSASLPAPVSLSMEPQEFKSEQQQQQQQKQVFSSGENGNVEEEGLEFDDPNEESMCSERNCCAPRGWLLFARRVRCARPPVIKMNKSGDPRNLRTISLSLPPNAAAASPSPVEEETGSARLPQKARPDNVVITSKYTIWTFFPAATALQFRRAVNVFYLAIILLLIIGYYVPDIFLSPYSPWGTFSILIIVIAVTLIFEGRDDIQRHRTDRATNSTRVTIVAPETGRMRKTTWGNISPGTLVVLHNREMVPADVVVIETSDPGARVYIETSGIDGETNLKIRHAGNEMRSFIRGDGSAAGISASSIESSEMLKVPSTIEKASLKVRGMLEYEEPNAFLQFSGKFVPVSSSGFQPNAIPIGFESVLLRGSEIRNTKWVLAVVVYAGHETKLILSKKNTPSKFSTIDILTNNLMYFTILEMFIMDAIAILLLVFWVPNTQEIWYFAYTDSLNVYLMPGWLSYFFTFTILLSNVVPIDMYVCVEIAAFVQGVFIDSDREMYDEESDTPAKARTGNLVSEIGQVTHVFSDKTGTLTQNIMSLVGVSIGGRRYGIGSEKDDGYESTASAQSRDVLFPKSEVPTDLPGKDDPDGRVRWFFKGMLADLESLVGSDPHHEIEPHGNLRKIEEFLVLLAVCHTVVIDEDEKGKPRYNAEGPDEEALVKAAAALGIRLISTGDEGYVIENERSGARVAYQILAVIAFTSTRKRMSVIVRRKDKESTILLLMKGADNVVAKRLKKEYLGDLSSAKHLEWAALDRDLQYFSETGLRTLVMCSKIIPENEFQEWFGKYQNAKVTTGPQREHALESVAELIEQNCELVGASAIEDALQEGVPETISILREAGINVWVLTGDKVETAINIGFASNLLDKNMYQIILDDEDPASLMETLDKILEVLRRLVKASDKEAHDKIETDNENMMKSDPEASTLRKRRLAEKNQTEEEEKRNDDLEAAPQPQADGDATEEVERLWDSQQELALVVTGKSLEFLLAAEKGDKKSEAKFVTLARACSVVLACRVSPSQKALVVRAVVKGSGQSRLKKPVSLSIGDGANDVAMIQEARIGVGISGKEGRQAVNNSDFSIAQFRFLKRLLLVHGRWNYRRNSQMIMYICYTFQAMNFLLFWYLFLSMVSGQQIYSNTYYVTFFPWFTGPMAVGFAWFDKDIKAETALIYPTSYIVGRENWDLSFPTIVQMLARSLVHAVICWVAVFYICLPLQNNDLGVLGVSIYITIIWTPLIYQFMIGRTWTWLMQLGIPVLLIAFPVIVSLLDFYQEGTSLLFTEGASVAWFAVFWALGTIIMIEHTISAFKFQFYPSSLDVLMENDSMPNNDMRAVLNTAGQGRRIILPFEKIHAAMKKQFFKNPTANMQMKPSGFVYDHPET